MIGVALPQRTETVDENVIGLWRSGRPRVPVTHHIAGSNPVNPANFCWCPVGWVMSRVYFGDSQQDVLPRKQIW